MRTAFVNADPVRVKRTYNFKRGTVIDHKTGVSLPLQVVLDGKIEPFIDARKKREAAS